MTSALEHWPAPPTRGWRADDLDHLPSETTNGERLRIELIDGALVFMPPQPLFHARVTRRLVNLLEAQLPDEWAADYDMSVKLGEVTRLLPDVVVFSEVAAKTLRRTYFSPKDVLLVVEVVSPESRKRDRAVEPARCAEAGIPHFWRVENENDRPVVYVHELKEHAEAYTLTGIFHGKMTLSVPYPIEVDLDNLPL